MGKWSKPTGKSGWACANCNEVHEDPPVLGQKSLNFEDVWIEDGLFVVDSKSPEPEALQLGKWLLARVEFAEGPICSECEYQHDKNEYEYGPIWECTDCAGEYNSESEADECCSYNRTYEERQEIYQQQEINRAMKLLEQQGFKVNGPNVIQGEKPVSAIKDW